MSDAPLTDCPACRQPRLRRLVSAAGFRLKGGGWYETDFKQGDKRNLADGGKEKPKESKPDGGDSGTQQKAKPAPADKASGASAGD